MSYHASAGLAGIVNPDKTVDLHQRRQIPVDMLNQDVNESIEQTIDPQTVMTRFTEFGTSHKITPAPTGLALPDFDDVVEDSESESTPEPVTPQQNKKSLRSKFLDFGYFDDLRKSCIDHCGGVDDTIQKITKDSSPELLADATQSLEAKMMNNRYATMGTDWTMLVAKGVEKIFNGEREFLGTRFDMTGWSNDVRIRTECNRPQLARMAGDVMEGLKDSPFLTYLVELMPGAVVYSMRGKKQMKYTFND